MIRPWVFICLLFSLTASAENPILDRYRDESLPQLDFVFTESHSRYDDPNHIPTDFKQLDDVAQMMRFLKFNTNSRAQCYQRAHLWAIEMRQMAKAKTQKVFLFFTDRYIREFRFKWWFHVAPMVLVNGKEFVVDPYFFDQPVDLQTWTNHFMPTHPICKVARTYQEYEAGNNEEYCFIRKLPMYYFTPATIEERDNQNRIVEDWVDSDVIFAHKALRPWWRF